MMIASGDTFGHLRRIPDDTLTASNDAKWALLVVMKRDERRSPNFSLLNRLDRVLLGSNGL